MHQPKKKPLSRSERNVLYVLVAFALVISLKTGLFDGYDYRTPELRRSLLSNEVDTTKDEDAAVDLEDGAAAGDGPTFVFVMGLEGTGHHFIGSLLENSPNMIKMKELGVCAKDGELGSLSSKFFNVIPRTQRGTGLFNPSTISMDASGYYENIVNTMKGIKKKYIDDKQGQDEPCTRRRCRKRRKMEGRISNDKPFNIAINANGCSGPSQMSYPNFMGKNRALDSFNLDVYYNACKAANVQCNHVYIYRNPYDVLKSTTKNRKFNKNPLDAIRLYTSVMQQIHSQMLSYPDSNLGCFGFLDVKGTHLKEDWKRFGDLFGWEDDTFMSTVTEIIEKSPMPMSEEMKGQLVPSRLNVLMKAFEDVHYRVSDLCYASLTAVEDLPVDLQLE